MADKPSRALILYGHGLAPLLTPSHSHFHSLASISSSGFLALDHSSPSPGFPPFVVCGVNVLKPRPGKRFIPIRLGSGPIGVFAISLSSEIYILFEPKLIRVGSISGLVLRDLIEGDICCTIFWIKDENLIKELAQLLDAGGAFCTSSRDEAPKGFPTIAERFMGMKAALVTYTPTVKCFGEKLGFTAMEFDKLKGQSSDDAAAFELLKLLGFQDGKTLDTDHFDLVFVHIGSDVKQNGQHDIDYLNNLIGRILEVAQPGSEIGSRLHLTLMMSFGASMQDDPNISLVSLNDGNKSAFSSLFPRQSYTLKGVNLREGIRHNCPMLIAQWQDAVTRKDMVEEFSFNEFRKHSGNLAIPADRFLYEVAFKLWKAPKYGA